MRIGKQDSPFSAICTSDADTITVRGHDLCGDIIGKMDFTSYFWLLVTGATPSETQRFFANAVLAAIAEHGLVPSVVAARMTYAAAPEAFHGAVAAGLLGCGSVVLGSAEVAGRCYAELVAATGTRRSPMSPLRVFVACARKSALFRALATPSTRPVTRARCCCSIWPNGTASSGRISKCSMRSATPCLPRSGAPCRSMLMARSRP